MDTVIIVMIFVKANFECSTLMFSKLTKLVMNLVAKLCDRFSVSLFLVTNMLINFCWHAACVEFLTIKGKYFSGPRPNVLTIDGIAVGLQNEDNVADKSSSEISGSDFSDKVFVKLAILY